MMYTYRKQIILFLIIVCVLIGGFVAYTMITSSSKEDVKQPSAVSVKPSTSAPLTEDAIQQITDNLTKLLVMKHGEGKYTVHIRDDSYNRSVSSNGAIMTRVLVDVPEKNETYVSSSLGTTSSPTGLSQVHCAPEEDQMVHPSVCEELGNE